MTKVMSVLMAASFLAAAGTTLAAGTSFGKSQGAMASNHVVQATTPLDCKKNPKDPRCKGKK